MMFVAFFALAQEDFGTLIFHDDFERSESQEIKDEPGNGDASPFVGQGVKR